ncbi:NADPH-dependent FMN reductase [Mesobacillus thioparans]|uniref:NADPH-dependent FMN reductase n=1 Tax=Mesobacillus thioparans TaxID=370439 RepID=UPI0039F06C00
MTDVKLLGILGSMSKDSTTEKALVRTMKAAQYRGADTEIFDLRECYLPFRDGRSDQTTYPDSVHTLREKVLQSDGVIFASPEYNGSYSAIIKNALDYLGPDYLRGKVVGVLGVAGDTSASNTVYHLQTILLRCGCWVLPKHVQIPFSHQVFSETDKNQSDRYNDILDALGIDMARSAYIFKNISIGKTKS